MPEDDESYNATKEQLDAYDKTISNFEAQASKIIAKGQGGQGGQGGELIDSFGNTGAKGRGNAGGDIGVDTFVNNPYLPQIFRDADYELAFGTEDDTNQVIVDNAVETANKNISGDNTEDVALADNAPPVLTDDKIDKYNPEDESLDSESAVPPAFLQTAGDNIVSGLGLAQASEQLSKKTSPVKQKKRERILIDFGKRFKRIDGLKYRLANTSPKNTKKINALNSKIKKIEKNIMGDFSKIYDSSEGVMSIDPRYRESVLGGSPPMPTEELVKLLRIYNKNQPQIFRDN